jgi:hypothetical protein
MNNNTFPSLRAKAIEQFIADKVLSGDECSKREVLEKLISTTDHSVNFLAYVSECSIAYVRKIKSTINTSLTQ